tara:strand:+ start:687 stop:863 length:177 start_codon:yes stop_codon:yes gene_type:complete
MSKPVDKILYNKIKKNIFIKNPINSAYRSGLLVKTYKKSSKKNMEISVHIQVIKKMLH